MNKKQRERAALEAHFQQQHDNPPKPFNPEYRPYAVQLSNEVTESMEEDKYYWDHTLKECGAEWRRRYEELRPAYEEAFQLKRKQP